MNTREVAWQAVCDKLKAENAELKQKLAATELDVEAEKEVYTETNKALKVLKGA